MKNLLLSVALIAIPVVGFATVWQIMPHTTQIEATSPGLGDLSLFQSIVTDTQGIVAGGDLAAAKTRIRDLEVAWDDAAAALRAKDSAAWSAVDDAADAALSALRASTPDVAEVKSGLEALAARLVQPLTEAPKQGGVIYVSGIPVTDETGHPLPCEEMLAHLKKVSEDLGRASDPAITDFRAKGTERCNADDDRNAATFFAQGLALLEK